MKKSLANFRRDINQDVFCCASEMALGMAMSVCWVVSLSINPSATLIQTEIPQQLVDGLIFCTES